MFNKLYDKVVQTIKSEWKFIVTIMAIFLLFNIELPYVIFTPGGSISLSERVEINTSYEVEGELGMAYVASIKASAPFLLASFVMPNWDVKSVNEVKELNDESLKETIARDKLYLQEAINNATFVAYTYANVFIEVKNVTNQIIYISEDADTSLKLFDEVLSVDTIDYNGTEELREYLKTKNVGDSVIFKIIRDQKTKEVSAKLYKGDDGSLKVGIASISLYEYSTDPSINVKFKNSESGPSGGLMTALSIYDKLVDVNVTNGKKVIGTGTIDDKGNVGEIGGVKYKLLGAAKRKADIFLCPKENLEEALKVKKENKLDIEVIGVATFAEALEVLK